MEVEATQQQGNKPGSKASERQAQISRLVSQYRAEANTLLKDVLKQQHRWRNELQERGVLTGIPNSRPYVKTLPHVRRHLSWKQAERDALKRQLLGLGLGRWKEIHSALSASLQQFKHGPGDVEDACWQLLCELQLLLATPEDRLFVARLLEPVAEWCPISTPGAPFSKLQGSAKSIVRRLALLQDFNQLLPSLQRSEAVAGMFRALAAAALPAAAVAPTSWWDVECDVALMIGMHRHGYGNFEAVRQDPDLTAAFQGFNPY
ncbi:hypothetical protein OEZ85_012943 [Tetradesmus obliquus]|uniref:Uncharacterized protein n=1 Tax=Tetradesmus obliquus TaxID=3088 RepID=A0ABY8U748_TETOB|nr:hypothetical protein OEZ85_012943 [Tetradesmus obliquus]